MRLLLFSDYSLRILLYAAAHPDRLVTVAEIADAYRISRHHIVKVVQRLIELKVIEGRRGRNGGLRLARPAAEINVGALVRETEPDFNLVECFDRATNTCAIASVCDLKTVLEDAKSEFLRVLDRYTIGDLLAQRGRLQSIWSGRLAKARGR